MRQQPQRRRGLNTENGNEVAGVHRSNCHTAFSPLKESSHLKLYLSTCEVKLQINSVAHWWRILFLQFVHLRGQKPK
jgi:hypothetical protein